VALILAAALWWFHDPFHLIGRNVIADQTIYYRSTEPLFSTPRRERTLFIKGVSMASLLAQTQKNYRTSDGWVYQTDVPKGFAATRSSPGDQIPESVSAIDDLDGKLEVHEIRAMSVSEVQLVKRTQGSEAFLLFPGAPVRINRPEGLDPNRFPTVN
jgi:hypothetical protein